MEIYSKTHVPRNDALLAAARAYDKDWPIREGALASLGVAELVAARKAAVPAVPKEAGSMATAPTGEQDHIPAALDGTDAAWAARRDKPVRENVAWILADAPAAENVSLSRRNAVLDGVRAFREILGFWVAGDLAALAPHTLDNGQPLNDRRRAALVQSDTRTDVDLAVTQALCRAVQALNVSRYTHVELHEARVAALAVIPSNPSDLPSDTPEPPADLVDTLKEDVTLFFVIPGSREAYTSWGRRIGGHREGESTLTDDDELRVFLRRLNGVWYWNPFGW